MCEKLLACGILLLGFGLHLSAQELKPGLYEITLLNCATGAGVPCKPVPATTAPASPKSDARPHIVLGVPYVKQICVTAAMIEHGNGNSARSAANSGRSAALEKLEQLGIQQQCTPSEPVRDGNRMTANLSCMTNYPSIGNMPATQVRYTGTSVTVVEANGDQHSIADMKGSVVMGKTSIPTAMHTEISRIYKGPDCGDVKPAVKAGPREEAAP